MFLSTVTSRLGHNVLTGPHKTEVDERGNPRWRQEWVDLANTEAVNAALARLSQQCKNVYFGLGAFAPDAEGKLRRRQANCTHLKSFWMDIDAGEKKFASAPDQSYPSQRDALIALGQFLDDTRIVSPTYIVSSGEGIHVYWVMAEDIPVREWKDAAERLKLLAFDMGLKADPSRTADAASVLRPVGTIHSGSGKVVSILDTQYIYRNEEFISHLEDLTPHYTPSASREDESSPLALLGPTPSYVVGVESSMHSLVPEGASAERIFSAMPGCAAMNFAYENQATLPYGEWAAALSILKFCDDGEEWAVKISENHPNYSLSNTKYEMSKWEGPRGCDWFIQNTTHCHGCPHRKEIRSPITLGMPPKEVQAEVTVISPKTPTSTTTTIAPPVTTVTLPNPPRGFVWGEENEIYYTEGGERELVYDYPFYLVDRIGIGDSREARYWFRFHSPQDGIIDFELNSDEVVADNQTLRQALSRNSIWLSSSRAYALMTIYIRRSLQDRQRNHAQLKAPQQMGWDGDTFIHGRTAFTAQGPHPAPIFDSNVARSFDRGTTPSRDPFSSDGMDEWNNVLDAMYGYEDGLLYQMVIAMTLGSPVRSKFGADVERGGIFNLYSEGSGVGKSTAAYTALRIFGDPRVYTVNGAQGATNNAFFTKMAYVNSTPMLFDEIGGLDYTQMMAFVHDSTRGSERMRMQASSNDLREASKGWSAFTLSTSNRSIWDMIANERVESEAYLMRVCEVVAKPVAAIAENPALAQELQNRLEGLHGIVAPKLLDYIVRNLEQMEQMWNQAHAYITSSCQLSAKMRYWANMGASAVVGAQLGEMLGVLPFSAQDIIDETVRVIRAHVARAKTKQTTTDSFVAEFLVDSAQSIMVVHTETSSVQVPPRGIKVRVHMWENTMYITERAVQDYCSDRGINLENFERMLGELGGVRTRYEMLYNTGSSLGTASPVWKLDTRKLDPKLVQPEELANETAT